MRNNKKAAVIGGTVLALTAGGVAYAYWTTTGEGTGTAGTRAGNDAALTVTQVSELAPMYPGDNAQGVNFTVKNEGSEYYKAQAVHGYITVAEAADAPAGECTATDYLFNGVSGADIDNQELLTFVAKDLAPGGTQGGSTTIKFNNTGENQDACKGAVVTIHYLAS
jgi:hypothetical protein